MQGLTTPSRKPSRPVIRSLSPSPKALSLTLSTYQEAQTAGRTQLSKFWIRSGKPCMTLQSKRLDEPVNCIIEANTTSDKQESGTQRPSGTFARASEP